LRTHGEHPIYQHLLNCFLLFGPNQLLLCICIAKFLGQACAVLVSSNNNNDPSSHQSWIDPLTRLYKHLINNLFSFIILAFLFPLLIFSAVSHKEPRFLLPLVVPMCLLTGHLVFGKQSHATLRYVWLSFNIIAVAVYGYVHQGGVVPALAHTQRVFMRPAHLAMPHHVIFYHTYMPPRHLVVAPFTANFVTNGRYVHEARMHMSEQQVTSLLAKDTDASKNSGRSMKERLDAAIPVPVRRVHELASSASLDDLERLIFNIRNLYGKRRESFALFLVAPATDHFDLTKSDAFTKCEVGGTETADTDSDSNHATSSKTASVTKRSNGRLQTSKNGTAPVRRRIAYELLTRFRFHVTFEHLDDHFDLVKCKFKRSGSGGANASQLERENYACFYNKCKDLSLPRRLFDSFSLNFYQVLL
jgi:hypothetical protein